MAHYLRFEDITKTFPGVKALDSVSFGVKEGSIHGLIGENGAGKSTLLHVLSGAYSPDGGQIHIDGRERVFNSTSEAISAGISVIYQELNLLPEMTVADNLLLGHYPRKYGFIKQRELIAKAAEQIETLGESFGANTKVKHLSIGQRQMVEIGKALLHNAKIITFDEPTSSLSEREVRQLFKIIRGLKEDGRCIIYVSHKLDEIFELCDSCTVLRDGRRIETFEDLTHVSGDQLVQRMVGREIRDRYGYEPRPAGQRYFEVRDLFGPGLSEPARFQIKAGEIVGFFGLVGAGRSELLKLIYGDSLQSGGEVFVNNKKVVIKNPRDAIRNRICLLPEERRDEGIIGERSVSENINISSRRKTLIANFFIDEKEERQTAQRFIDALEIKTPSREQLLKNLSGGNQQKTILARWLSEKIDVFLFDEPTKGIDVGAKYDIYQIIYELAKQGKAIAFVSSDLMEILGVADRIIVMRSGRIVGNVARAEAGEEKILSMALPTAR